ncbi:MAG: thioredoxin-related protein [Bacteroidia bacterium]|jgi:thioredoxin-related protein
MMKSMIKKSIGFLIMLFSCFNVSAQTWLTDYSSALEKASSNNKNILLVFSESDWCAQCIRLKKEVLYSDEFSDYGEQLILLNADFPRKRIKEKQLIKQNEALAGRFNPKGIFPYMVLLDQAGKKMGAFIDLSCPP